jgi:acyl phosphate:glycerol-3-phosphate acyltransferase
MIPPEPQTLLIASLLLVAAYLLGSFPTGFIACKWLKGIDIREVGSGSTGATNVLRTLGKPAGITVFAIDVGKGVLAILLTKYVLNQYFEAIDWVTAPDWIIVLAGSMGILGHSKPVWLGFKGGKSVAISLGVLLAMDWRVGLSALGIFFVTILLTRIVSISSIAAAAAVVIVMSAFQLALPYLLFALMGSAYVIWLHRANIQRLIAGTEPKIGQKLTTPELPQEPQS